MKFIGYLLIGYGSEQTKLPPTWSSKDRDTQQTTPLVNTATLSNRNITSATCKIF